MESKRILIVTYYFPPDPSIGSRRWAKFAKYFKKLGHEVKVISVDTKGNGSPWDDDVKDIPVTRIPYRYFRILDTRPTTLIYKIWYRIAFFLTGFFSKGTRFDRALFLKSHYTRAIRKELSQGNYDAVFVNGPPHRVMYFTTLLKSKFPKVKFISDFRDPWTWWYNLGYPTLKTGRINFEQKMEEYVVVNSDLVLCPINPMSEHLISFYPEYKTKILLVPHGFDPNDFKFQEETHKSGVSDPIMLIYFGAVYSQAKKEWDLVLNFLCKNNSSIKLNIFSSDYEEGIFNSYRGDLVLNDVIPPNHLFSEIKSNDFIVLVYPKDFKDYFASKFYEMVNSRVPILYFGYYGETAKYIEKNSLGAFFNFEDYQMWDEINQSFCVKQYNIYNRAFEIDNFSFGKQAENLLEHVFYME